MYEFYFEYIYSTFYPLFLHPSIRPAIYLSICPFVYFIFFGPFNKVENPIYIYIDFHCLYFSAVCQYPFYYLILL